MFDKSDLELDIRLLGETFTESASASFHEVANHI
jgi:hypothetical protein